MEEQIEIYKDIIGYEGLYKVSNLGNVQSYGKYKNKKEIFLKQTLSKDYKTVTLSKDLKIKKIKVHRLVGLMFIPNPLNKKQINHIDGNKANNNVNNLEWNTASENINHRYNVLNHKNSYLNKKINQYNLNNIFIKTWNSIIIAEKELNIGHTISKVCKGKQKTAGGFIWKYAD